MNKKSRIITLAIIIIVAALLRFYSLSTNPPGLYWDEAVSGYDAYSILKTAHDHHGNFMPLLFESFGDWKLPGYHYLLVPSIAVFGLGEFAIRFPSALLGTLTVPLLYLLVKKLMDNEKLDAVALLSAFFLAISPWHIQFSRGGFESTAGLFFVTLATYLFILGSQNKKFLYLTLSFTFYVLSMYTYHAYRIFTPLLVIALFVILKGEILKLKRHLVIPLITAVIIFTPLALATLSEEGRARASSQSAFHLNEFEAKRIEYDQKSKKPLRILSGIVFKTPLYYPYVTAKGYLDHFSPQFLFLRGDQTGRHSQVDMGQIYIFDAVLILAALFALRSNSANKLMVAWILLAAIPASIVTPTPHANRALQMVIPLSFLSGLGAYHLSRIIKSNSVKIILILIAAYWFISYLHLLFAHYPKKFNADWQDGYRQMVQKVQKYQDSFEAVYITNINQVPYIYVLFYQKYDPSRFVQLNGQRDRFDKYVFISPGENVYNKGRILYVAPSWEKVDGTWLDAANDSAGRHIYSLWEVSPR